MITQDFLTELELSLIRSYARASRISSTAPMGSTVESMRASNDFTNAFMETFAQRRPILERQIAVGGHHNPPLISDQVNRMVEKKLKSALFQKGNKLDRGTFDKMTRELKTEIRTLFYARA